MSLKPEYAYDLDELKFFGELGWFASLSVTIASLTPYLLEIFG
jgi:hypothetical protein